MSSDTDTPTRKPLKLSSSGKLELKKPVDGGQVRQSFPHGRSKTVAVEVKKKRTYAPGAGGKMEVSPEAEPKHVPSVETSAAPVDLDHHGLTAHERAARLKALEQAKRDEELRKIHEAEEAARAAERAERERAEAEKRRQEEAVQQAEAAKVAAEKAKADAAAPARWAPACACGATATKALPPSPTTATATSRP